MSFSIKSKEKRHGEQIFELHPHHVSNTEKWERFYEIGLSNMCYSESNIGRISDLRNKMTFLQAEIYNIFNKKFLAMV